MADAALELVCRQPHLRGAKSNFLAHRSAEQLGVGILEHKAHALVEALSGNGILQKRRIDHVPVKQVRARVRKLKAIDKAHDCRLAAAIGTEQRNKLTAIDLQRHAVDNRVPRIGEHYVAQLDEWGYLGASCTARTRHAIRIISQNVALPYLHPQPEPAAPTTAA